MTVLDSLVAGIEVNTAWGPPLYLDQPFAAQAQGGGIASLLQPQFIVHYRTGETQDFAPYGAPGASKWPFLALGAAAVLALAVLGALSLRRK